MLQVVHTPHSMINTCAFDGMATCRLSAPHPQIICMVGVQNLTLATPQGLPQTLETLLTHCLARNPEARPSFKNIADTLSHFVQVIRGMDAAELWGGSTLTPLGDVCVCPLAEAEECCTTCSHRSDCVEASCFCCRFTSAASPAVASREHAVNTPRDSAAANGRGLKQSPSMPKDGNAAGHTFKQSPCQYTAVSKLDMEAAFVSAKADQAKQSCSSTPPPGGKGMRRTLLSI